jgi:nucleoside-diphosphate-sugar epimerase
MSRIFVSGANGFVGAAVVRRLAQSGHDVAALVRQSSDRGRLSGIPGLVEFVEGDLDQPDVIGDHLRRFSPTIVVNLAWHGVKNGDRNNPLQLRNLALTLDLYRECAELGVEHFVGIGSQAEYGPHPAKIDEKCLARPTTLYGAVKLALSHILERLTAADGVGFSWLRLFSSYGPSDDPTWLIPYLILRLLRGEHASLTKGEQVWDYIYIDDVARAVLAVVEKRAQGVFNVGSGEAVPLRSVFLTIRDLIDPSVELALGEIPYRVDQVMHLEADISRLFLATGWRPSTPIRAGLEQTIAWYRELETARMGLQDQSARSFR